MKRFLPLTILLIATAAFAGRVSLQTFETTGATGECFIRDTVAANGGSWTSCPGGGGVSDSDYGDITVSGGVWNIDADTITTTELANGAVALANIYTAADDLVLVSNGSGWETKSVPDCDDSGGNHLNYDTATNVFSCGTSGGGSGLDHQQVMARAGFAF